MRRLIGTSLAAVVAVIPLSSHAQTSAGAPAPRPATSSTIAPAHVESQPQGDNDSQGGERDGIRLRGGVSFGGGPIFPWGLPLAQSVGGMGSINVRLGVQLFHALGIYAQSMNTIGGIGVQTMSGGTAAYALFQSYNSALLSLTIAHLLEIAAGPSLDYVTFVGCDSSTVSCGSGEGAGLGVHARVSLNIGGISGRGPRRTAFNIGLDAHPLFFLAHGGGMFATALTLGVEWY
jgi:hypothetical protein